MKNIMKITATVACAFALTACGGGSGSSNNNATTSSQADEGIWSDLSNISTATYGMQAIILSDSSYWGIYGWVDLTGAFSASGILHGTASVSGNGAAPSASASGTYTNLQGLSSDNGVYSGTVSAQSSLNLTFYEPSVINQETFNMSYDSIYGKPISLSSIAGNYPAVSYAGTIVEGYIPAGGSSTINNNTYPNNINISGSSLTVYQNGNVIMTGTIAQHGTTSVFDVSLTATTTGAVGGFPGNLSTGTTFNGILFQTSSGILENDIEIVAAAGNSAFFYLGSK